MIGSHLLGQQPTFAGTDFGIPEVALFGYYQFRSAVPTSDTWELHDGAEFLFMQSGEACWELADEHFSMVNGNQALVFPAGQRHRISNGIYTPCRLFWIVFRPAETARQVARLFLASEVEALAEIAKTQERPVDLSLECRRNLGELCARLTDERLLIGSATMTAEVRSRIYSAVTSMWELLSSGAHSGAQSRLVRRAAALLRTDAAARDYADHEDSIEEVAHQLGYGKSHLYNLFTREVGMAPNDYRQRVRIKRCCERLAKGNDPITTVALDNGFHSTQYFARVFKKYVGVTASDYRMLFQTD